MISVYLFVRCCLCYFFGAHVGSSCVCTVYAGNGPYRPIIQNGIDMVSDRPKRCSVNTILMSCSWHTLQERFRLFTHHFRSILFWAARSHLNTICIAYLYDGPKPFKYHCLNIVNSVLVGNMANIIWDAHQHVQLSCSFLICMWSLCILICYVLKCLSCTRYLYLRLFARNYLSHIQGDTFMIWKTTKCFLWQCTRWFHKIFRPSHCVQTWLTCTTTSHLFVIAPPPTFYQYAKLFPY